MEKYQCGGLNSIQYKFGACKPEIHNVYMFMGSGLVGLSFVKARRV